MATKLELIQQNRASGMSYLEAAKSATQSLNTNSDENRLARLEANGMGSGTAANNLRAKTASADFLSSVDALSSGLGGDISATESGNPDAPISSIAAGGTGAKTVSQLATAVSPTAQNIGAQKTAQALTSTTVPPSSNNTQGNTSSIKGGTGASTQKDTTNIVEGQTNKVIADSVAGYEANNQIDKTQFEQQKLAAEAKAMEVDTELKRKDAENRALAEEEDRIQKQKAAQDAANLSALQEKERASNRASIAAAEAKAAASERELQIANDIELQKSNVAFAKMGLTMSTAAVTSAQQIFTTGVYNLSKLKSENAFKMADLQVAVAKVEFDHTKVINDIINGSTEKSYEIRKKLNEDIYTIKNSIIDNRFERQTNIDKAIDGYQKAIKDNEEEVLNRMNKANEVLSKSVTLQYDALKAKETYHSEKIAMQVSSGKWWRIGYDERSKMEQSAGLPRGTIAAQIDAQIGSSIYKQAQEITGLKGITFGAGEYNYMVEEAKQLVRNGIPPDTAINQVVTQHLSKSPEYAAALAKSQKSGVSSSGGKSTSAYKGTLNFTNNKGEEVTLREMKDGTFTDLAGNGISNINEYRKVNSQKATTSEDDGW